MPANLNALIRYKTIDLCLMNSNRKWTIKDLMVACSEALREHRGLETGVSERTLRDDIRVMRSNILGFNAPIKQKNGLYYYSDPSYSIFQASLVKKRLLRRVLKLLLELRAELDHPELEILIGKLAEVLPEDEELTEPSVIEEKEGEKTEEQILEEDSLSYMRSEEAAPSAPEEDRAKKRIYMLSLKKERKTEFTFHWRDVLDLI